MGKAKEKADEIDIEYLLRNAVTKVIALKHLIIRWPGAQRYLKSDAHAKTLAANFDPYKFGIPIVTLPDERGYYHVCDGFNRIRAATILFGEECSITCQVIPIDDPVSAAVVFLGLNKGRKVVTPLDNFRVGIAAQEEDKVAINKLVRSLGYKIDSRKEDSTISAVGALTAIYNTYGADILKNAIELVQATWGMDSNAVIGPILLGYATFIAQYGNKANWGRLKTVVQKRFTPGQFLGAARTLRESERNGLNDAIVRLLVNVYNRGMKTGGLTK